MENKTYILGVGVSTTSEIKILKYIKSELAKPKESREKLVVFTPNPEQISAANLNPSLKGVLNQAQIALPDGIGLVLAARLLGKPIYARITGVDFMKNLVKSVSKQPVKTGFLGGQPGVAEETSVCLQKMTSLEGGGRPNFKVTYTSPSYNREKMIRSDIDILFVALGFPKQEKWIIEHKDEIPADVIMAVGGSFDILSGRIPRAPKFMRSIGLEWLFRLIIQPWRIFRQARLLHFSTLIFWEALTSRVK